MTFMVPVAWGWGLDDVSYAVDTCLIALGAEILTRNLGAEGFLSHQYDTSMFQSTTQVTRLDVHASWISHPSNIHTER
jgi:hypothetical protein